ncbi:hypothetical protein DW884_17700 [Ruminococcus sp. AM40-10AC]|nr:hypothetical protein DW884_17700 [Ruminococcus sp. AM40-10AC]RHT07244.1 hypothetical protein DW842_17545 [Ruminococcus sp. AM36-17]
MSKYRNEAVMNLYQEPEDSILKSSSEVSVKRFSLSRFLFITGGVIVFLTSMMLAMSLVKAPVYGDSSSNNNVKTEVVQGCESDTFKE